jgi:hypothetical protein
MPIERCCVYRLSRQTGRSQVKVAEGAGWIS